MNRRKFVTAAAASPLLSQAAPAARNQYFELRYLRLRNGTQPQRTNDFFSKSFLPAVQRLGIGPVGFFSPVIGEESPYMLVLTSYPSLDAGQAMHAKLAADPAYQKGLGAYLSPPDVPYVRIEASVLRAFDTMPALVPPPTDAKRAARIFELRTYESNNFSTLRRKIKMFNEGEIGIFQRLGMSPVFFGETIFGRNLPNLTYMLAYDDLAARERLWNAFGADEEWKKMRSKPENADAEIVSNISNTILRPAAFSQIR